MDLTSPKTVKDLLAEAGIQPKKSLGQNFLTDRNVLNKIADASAIAKEETVVEIGPGLGTLTQELAKRAGRVIAVEKDRNLLPLLRQQLLDVPNVDLISSDILDWPVPEGAYQVVSNLPYSVTSPVLRKFLEADNKPGRMVLLVQKEVADRIASSPPRMSLLSVSVQFYGTPKVLFKVKPGSFYPAPDVDSALIRIVPHEKDSADPKAFFRVVRAGFRHPRRQLLGNLVEGLGFSRQEADERIREVGIRPDQRAETLSIEDWQNLAEAFSR